MFPWSPEFIWDTGHIIFFGALYSVLATIATAFGVASWRAFRDQRTGRAFAIAWHADFEELPRSARACRHNLTGEAPGRTCGNGFDCRSCSAHPEFEALRAQQARPADAEEVHLGVELPLDRHYHRGHTWVRAEKDGTVTVGLDEIARRLLGTPDKVELPAVGERLREQGPLARLRSRGSEVRLLAPVDGTVSAVVGSGSDFTLRVAPSSPLDTCHLLAGGEARVWAMRELERLQRAIAPAGVGPALADGGELVADVGAALPRDRYDAVVGEMFLEP